MRTLVTLGIIIIAMFGGLFAGARWSDGSLTPKLALDLAGGTQLILRPIAENNAQVTDADIKQAIDIIRQRVDASGVSEAEITSQGSGNRAASSSGCRAHRARRPSTWCASLPRCSSGRCSTSPRRPG